MKHIILTCSMILLLASQAWADGETLYVRSDEACANNGNGTAYGCAASAGAVGAFRASWRVLYDTVNTAAKVDPGDTLYICGPFVGTNGSFNLGVLDASGNGAGLAGKPVTYDFDCPGDPGSVVMGLSGNYAIVSFKRFIIVRSPRGTGGAINTFSVSSSTGATGDPVNAFIYGGVISDNTITGQKCVNLRGQDIYLDGMIVHDCADDGIWTTGKRMTIKNTNVYLISKGTITGDCWQTSQEMDGTEWGSNYCDHANVDSKYCGVLTTDTDGGTVWVHDNVCLKRSTDVLGDGFRSDTNTIFERNVVTGGTYGIHCNQVITEFCRVIGNVFIGQGLAGVRTEAGTVDVAYNTFIDQVTVGHRMVGTTDAQRSYNNLFVNAPTGILKDSSNTPLDFNNLFYLTTNTLLVNVTPTTPGTGSLLATNPLFVGSTYTDATGRLNGGARTRGTSPARNAASTSGLCTDVRARGCKPSNHDMGAYQATSGDPAPARTAR